MSDGSIKWVSSDDESGFRPHTDTVASFLGDSESGSETDSSDEKSPDETPQPREAGGPLGEPSVPSGDDEKHDNAATAAEAPMPSIGAKRPLAQLKGDVFFSGGVEPPLKKRKVGKETTSTSSISKHSREAQEAAARESEPVAEKEKEKDEATQEGEAAAAPSRAPEWEAQMSALLAKCAELEAEVATLQAREKQSEETVCLSLFFLLLVS